MEKRLRKIIQTCENFFIKVNVNIKNSIKKKTAKLQGAFESLSNDKYKYVYNKKLFNQCFKVSKNFISCKNQIKKFSLIYL